MKKSTKGKAGEDLAEAFLKQKGMEILARNFRTECGEIDIVAATEGYVVFVEVKARSNSLMGTGAESVTKAKIKRICQTASQYLAKYLLFDTGVRFDVLEINGENGEINHIENAFDCEF